MTAERRRLRAALGASADALYSSTGLDAHALLHSEIDFLAAIAPDDLRPIWRDLRNQALALAAAEAPIEILEARLAADEALRRR